MYTMPLYCKLRSYRFNWDCPKVSVSLHCIMARQALEYPWPFRFLRMAFPYLEKLVPGFAHSLAIRLFLIPIRFRAKPADLEAAKTFDQYTIKVGEEDLVVYSKGEGPEVLCLHGWSGKAMQFRRIAERLVQEGYRCVLVDAPGHGRSTGGRTSIFEFQAAFNQVFETLQQPVAVVGHSLGAASISLAVHDGTEVPSFAVFGAPVVGEDILQEFRNRVNASESTTDHLKERAIKEFGRTFESVTMQETFKAVNCPCIGFHGVNDLDAPVYHLDVLKEVNPRIETHKYEGVGHRRILKDDVVIDDFIVWLNRQKESLTTGP